MFLPRAGLEPARPYGQRIFLPLRLSPPEIKGKSKKVKGKVKTKALMISARLLPFYFYLLPFLSLWSGLYLRLL